MSAQSPVSLLPVLPLPLPFPLPDASPLESGVVRQHYNMTFAHQKVVSVLSKRIMARVLEQIKFGEKTLAVSYQVGIMDVVRNTDLHAGNVYAQAKTAIKELAGMWWEFEDQDEKEFIVRHLLNTTLPKDESSRVKGGLITIALNPELAPYFVNLASSYTVFELRDYLELPSWYAMRFFEILAHWKTTGVWYVSVADFRAVMHCGPELDKHGKPRLGKNGKPKMKMAATAGLISNCIKPAQLQLADTPYAFDFRPVCEVKAGPGQPRITAFTFTLRQPRLVTIPREWLDEPESAHLIGRLRKFAITDGNIMEYWQVLLPSGFNKLLREWQLKEISQERINSKVSYCNAALVRAGKKLLELRRTEALQYKGQQQLFPTTLPPEWQQGQGQGPAQARDARHGRQP